MSDEQPPPSDGSGEPGPGGWQAPGQPGQPGQSGGPPPAPGPPYPGPYPPPQGQPYPGQPYWPPPGQSGPSDGRPRGMSNTAKFWLGTGLSIPALLLISVISQLISLIFGPSFDARFALIALLLLAAAVIGLIYDKTRFVVLGIIAGIAVLFVVLAGACVALLTAFQN